MIGHKFHHFHKGSHEAFKHFKPVSTSFSLTVLRKGGTAKKKVVQDKELVGLKNTLPGNGARPPTKHPHCLLGDFRPRASKARRSSLFCPLRGLLGTFSSSPSTWHSAIIKNTQTFTSEKGRILYLRLRVSIDFQNGGGVLLCLGKAPGLKKRGRSVGDGGRDESHVGDLTGRDRGLAVGGDGVGEAPGLVEEVPRLAPFDALLPGILHLSYIRC